MRCAIVLRMLLVGHIVLSVGLLILGKMVPGNESGGLAMLSAIINLPGLFPAIGLSLIVDKTPLEFVPSVLALLVSSGFYGYLGRCLCPGFRGLLRKRLDTT